jgi:hypothetical protein
MRNTAKWLMLVITLALVTSIVSCGRPDPVEIWLKADNRTEVGASLQLDPVFAYAGDRGPTADEAKWDKSQVEWTVRPSATAAISSEGVFTATKAGVYTVTARWDQRSMRLSTTTKVYVTEVEAASTSEETEEESTTTTETTVANSYTGRYEGSWLWKAGNDQADVPWGFIVDSEGKVVGGFEAMLTKDTRVICSLSGQVSDDGQVSASGTANTEVEGVGSNSTPMTLSGQIAADGTFTGKLVGSGGQAVDVTAARK